MSEFKGTIGKKDYTKKEWFWSGNSLMCSNNDGTFSSSHLLTTGDIKPDNDVKKLIAAATDLLQALQYAVDILPEGGTKEEAKRAIQKALN